MGNLTKKMQENLALPADVGVIICACFVGEWFFQNILSVTTSFFPGFLRFLLQISSFRILQKISFCEVFKGPLFKVLAKRDFTFCSKTIGKASHFLYCCVYNIEKFNLGALVREIVEKCGSVQELCSEILLLQKVCPADFTIPVVLANLIL